MVDKFSGRESYGGDITKEEPLGMRPVSQIKPY